MSPGRSWGRYGQRETSFVDLFGFVNRKAEKTTDIIRPGNVVVSVKQSGGVTWCPGLTASLPVTRLSHLGRLAGERAFAVRAASINHPISPEPVVSWGRASYSLRRGGFCNRRSHAAPATVLLHKEGLVREVFLQIHCREKAWGSDGRPRALPKAKD